MRKTQESSFKRIARISTPAIGASDTRLDLYALDHHIVGEYGANGTDLAPKAMPFIRKICSLLNGSFRRSSDRKRTICFRPLLPKQEQISRSGNHRRASQKATKKCPVRASKPATFDDLHRLKMDDLKQVIGSVR